MCNTSCDTAEDSYFEPRGQECSHCGNTIQQHCGIWVEPGNMGFSGWDGGMWLCETCAEDYRSGALDYES